MRNAVLLGVAVLICLLLLTSCGYNIQATSTKNLPPKSDLYDVPVLGLNDRIPSEYISQVEQIGSVYVGDTAFGPVMGFNEVVALAQTECRKMGGDFIKITEVKYPDLSSTNYRIRAAVYAVSDSQKLELENVSSTSYSEANFKEYLTNKSNDKYEGIYSEVVGEVTRDNYRLGLLKEDDYYLLIYFRGVSSSLWKEGDVKARLELTAKPGIFLGSWVMLNKSTQAVTVIFNDDSSFEVFFNSQQTTSMYVKMFPKNTSSQSAAIVKSGTGFLINQLGYLVTNYHVVENARKISVKGGSLSLSGAEASVIVADKTNDLCILKLSSNNIDLPKVEYGFDEDLYKSGTSVFCMGYPLTSLMGSEIKVTDGIISSTTGFQGDITTYQISSPVQPGNSGGPLFNNAGNVIGVINAKIPSAENVSYAIKFSYLKNLLQLVDDNISLTKTDKSNLTLSQKIESFKKTIYLIEIQ